MYSLTVVTPEKLVFQDQASSVVAPGTLGYLEILRNHAAIITSLQPGKLVITDKGNNKLLYAVSGGILEMFKNECTILADAIETPEEIDIARAHSALERAKKRIEAHEKGLDLVRIKKALHRAENRIAIYQKFQAHTTPHRTVLNLFE